MPLSFPLLPLQSVELFQAPPYLIQGDLLDGSQKPLPHKQLQVRLLGKIWLSHPVTTRTREDGSFTLICPPSWRLTASRTQDIFVEIFEEALPAAQDPSTRELEKKLVSFSASYLPIHNEGNCGVLTANPYPEDPALPLLHRHALPSPTFFQSLFHAYHIFQRSRQPPPCHASSLQKELLLTVLWPAQVALALKKQLHTSPLRWLLQPHLQGVFLAAALDEVGCPKIAYPLLHKELNRHALIQQLKKGLKELSPNRWQPKTDLEIRILKRIRKGVEHFFQVHSPMEECGKKELQCFWNQLHPSCHSPPSQAELQAFCSHLIYQCTLGRKLSSFCPPLSSPLLMDNPQREVWWKLLEELKEEAVECPIIAQLPLGPYPP